MKRILQFLLIAIVVAALAIGGYWVYQNQAASATTSEDGTYTQVVAVEQGDLTASLSVVGQLEAVQSAELAFEQMSGTAKLQSLAAATGQTVIAGQVLAAIDSAPYQQALDEAKSGLQEAEETLAELQTPPTDLEIAQADMAFAEAELALEQARADLADLSAPDLTSLEYAVQNAQDALDLAELESSVSDRDSLAKSERDLTYTIAWYQRHIAQLEQLEAQNRANLEQIEQIAEDRESLAQARADLATVQAERELARKARAAESAQLRAALAEAKVGGDELTQAQAQQVVREAEVALEAARLDRAELDEGPDATTLASAQAQVDKQRLGVSEAEEALAGTELVAPFDGTILETHVSVGDPIASNSAIVTLANLGSMQVVASVDETTIRQVSAGQRASISFDAYPSQTFEGEVLSVPLYGALQGGVTVYDVPLSLAGAEALNLLVGMTANVEIETGHASDALLVPTLALQKVSGSYQVSVPNTLDPAGEPETVPVQIGLSNGTYTQIVKGLIAGDQVIVQLNSTQSAGNFQDGSSGVFSNIFRFRGRP